MLICMIMITLSAVFKRSGYKLIMMSVIYTTELSCETGVTMVVIHTSNSSTALVS